MAFAGVRSFTPVRYRRPMPQAVVPVAAAFLERLLFDSDPGHAVSTLSEIWSVRADAQLPYFGLDPVEYSAQLCLIYTGAVGNGGHTQFFSRGGKLVRETAEALLAAALPELERTLFEATLVFPDQSVPMAPDEAEEAYARLPEPSLKTLDELDRQAFRVLPHVDGCLLTYLRAHRSGVLLPETPIAKRRGYRIE
jgi:hypothetical protein